MKTQLRISAILLTFVTLFTFNAKADENNKLIVSKTFDKPADNASNSYSIGDELYLTLKLDKPLSDYYNKYNYKYDFNDATYNYNHAIRILVDGELTGQILLEAPESAFGSKTTYKYALASSKERISRQNYSLIMSWMEMLREQDAGKHTIELQVVPVYADVANDELPVLASQEISYNINKSDLQVFSTETTTAMPPSTINSMELEDKIVDASRDLYTAAIPIDATITDMRGDWTYFTDNTGNITHRSIIATVAYYWPTQDKCTIKTARFSQDHQGYGKFDNMRFYKEVQGYFDHEVPCSKITDTNFEEYESY